MNLIEQLGGYREAKEWLDANEHEVKHGYLKDYRRELLQHRRENNIFEKGDLVIHVDDIEMRNVMIVDDANAPEAWIVNSDIRINISNLKHATDKEIAQGYRDE